MNTYIENQNPDYDTLNHLLSSIHLEFSGSELHGMMCGFLCADKEKEGEDYLRALLMAHKDDLAREAALSIHQLFAYTQQQLLNFDFSFKLFLPEDEMPLVERAQAFSEWCSGFIYGIAQGGLSDEDIDTEESQELITHIEEFANLDYDSLSVGEEDEKALTEVSEYARMSVLHLFAEVKKAKSDGTSGAQSTRH